MVAGEGCLASAYLKNGTVLEIGQSYANGQLVSDQPQLHVGHMVASETAFGVEAIMMIHVYHSDKTGAQEILKNYLELWGLTPKFGSMDFVFSELDRAYAEAQTTILHHKWHGSGIYSQETLDEGLAVETSLYEALRAMYEEVKDAETVRIDSDRIYQLAIPFSKLSEISTQGLTVEGQTVSLTNVTLATTDSLLLIEGEPYAVLLALENQESGELIHLSAGELNTVAYDGSGTLRVSAGEAGFSVPVLTEGAYKLVAYLATADGIRVSEVAALRAERVNTESITVDRLIYTATKAEDESLLIIYKESNDVILSLEGAANADYAAFCNLIADAVYPYGMPNEVIEILGEGGEYAPLTGAETALNSGEYRVKFTVSNGEKSHEGYAFITYTAVEVITPPVDPVDPQS